MARLRIGPLPQSPEFHPVELGWTKLRELSPALSQAIAFPIGVGMLALLYGAWLNWAPGAAILPDSRLGCLTIIFIVVIVHESLHAIAHPGNGFSDETYIGFWPRQLTPYAHYVGEMSRNRAVVFLLLPFVVISVLPLFLSTVLSMPIPYGAFISPVNGLLSCVDLLGALLLVVQVPQSAIIRNQGWDTWWHAD